MAPSNCDIRAALASSGGAGRPWAKAYELAESEILTCARLLPDRIALAVIRRYGLDGKAPMTLQGVADSLGPRWGRITREGARQMVATGVRRMANVMGGEAGVRLEDVVLAQSVELTALISVLERKGLLTQAEVQDEVKRLRKRAAKGQQPGRR